MVVYQLALLARVLYVKLLQCINDATYLMHHNGSGKRIRVSLKRCEEMCSLFCVWWHYYFEAIQNSNLKINMIGNQISHTRKHFSFLASIMVELMFCGCNVEPLVISQLATFLGRRRTWAFIHIFMDERWRSVWLFCEWYLPECRSCLCFVGNGSAIGFSGLHFIHDNHRKEQCRYNFSLFAWLWIDNTLLDLVAHVSD